MKFLDRLKSLVGIKVVDQDSLTAASKAVTRLISIRSEMPDNERIRQSAWRIDAIRRYIAQEAEDRNEISPQKMDEFRLEVREKAMYLLTKKQIDYKHYDALIASIPTED